MAKEQGHTHKCTICGKEYKHYTQTDISCKEPTATICGVCKK